MNSLLLSLAVASTANHPPLPVAYPQPVVAVQPYVAHSHGHYMPWRPHALTLDQFARVFQPTPGFHRIRVIHPATGLPVEVSFQLPHGRLREFEVNRHEIEFVTQTPTHHHCVKIIFLRDGCVDVRGD